MTHLNLILSWFGAGYFPKAPGTAGSLAALPFIWALKTYGGTWALPIFVVSTFIIGYFATKAYLQKHPEDSDPSFIVIDEVVGQSIPFLIWDFDFIHWTPYSWTSVPLAFALFRLFDIWKPWPVSWADQLHGSASKNALGVMLDDVLAGVYTTIILVILLLSFPHFFFIK